MRHLFGPLRHLNFWETAAFETNGGGGGGGGGGSSSSSGSSTTTTIPVYDNYYDAIDAEGVGATVNIGGNIVKAETADGYTGIGSTASNSYIDDTFGTGNIYTESTPGASTVNYGNTVNYSHSTDNDNDNDYSYVDTSTPAGIAAASGDDYVFNPDDNTVVYDPIVSTGTGTSTAGTGGYDGSTYDEVPDVYTPIDFDDEDYTPTSDELNAAIDAAGGINLTKSDYAEPVDYTTTGSGADYTSTATADDDDPYVAPIPDPEPPAPPPVYYDALGNPYGSQAEAAAADAAAEAAAAKAAADMAAAFDEPTPAEIAAAQREAYDEDEFTVMSQPVAPAAATVPSSSEISGAGVSDEEIDSMRENILTGDYDFEPEPLDFSFLDETNELLGELGVDPIDVSALTKVGDTGINLAAANAPSAITEMALGMGSGDPDVFDPRNLGGAEGYGPGPSSADDAPITFENFVGPLIAEDDDDDDLATDFSAIPTGFGATDDDLATDFSTVSFPTASEISPEDFRASEAALAGIDFETGLPLGGVVPDEDIQKGGALYENTLDSIKDRVAEVEGTSGPDGYNTLLGYSQDQFTDKPLTEMTVSEVLAMQKARGPGTYAEYSKDTVGRIATPAGKYQVVGQTLQGLVDQGIVDPNALYDAETQEDIGSYLVENRGFEDLVNGDITQDEFEANLGKEFEGIERFGYDTSVTSSVDGQSGTDLYLSAMEKVSDPNYDPNNSNLTETEQRALYGARGQTPNAAETAYLNDLLSNARHAKDSEKIGADGEPIYKAGDYVTEQSFGDKLGDFAASAFDLFFNPLSAFGEDFTIVGQNKNYVQEQLDAYKNGGTFVYDDDGKTVVGIAEANYDAIGDGQNDTVVLYDEDGNIQVTSDAVGVEDVKISNANADGEEFDIDIVDSDRDYTNTEDGVVTSTGEVVQGDGDDDNIPICEEGFEFDPVEGICMPIDTIGDGTKVKLKPRPPQTTDPDGPKNTLPVMPPPSHPALGGGLTIRQPKFNKGGVVTRNIDKFANGGVVTPNIDNFMSGMR